MKIAFFGTSDKSEPILNTLNDSFSLVLCITKADTKVGRKQEKRETGVKSWARKNTIDFVEIEKSMKASQEEIISKLKKHEIELAVMADFSFIVPEEIIKTPKHGIINVHFSLLPLFRGASPVQHAILSQHEITGVTYYLMDAGMDTGNILEQSIYEMAGNETAETLYKNLFEIAARDLPQVINDYTDGNLLPQQQENKTATYCYSKTNPKSTLINKDDARLDWSSDVDEIEAAIRAFYPWPVAWTTIDELEENDKISEGIKLKQNVDENLRVKIYPPCPVENGRLKIEKLQIEGKNITDWKSFKNGYSLT